MVSRVAPPTGRNRRSQSAPGSATGAAVGVLRLAPVGLASPAASARRRARGLASAGLEGAVRAEDHLWGRGERLIVSIGGINTATAARRVGRRLARVAADAVRGVARFEVVVAVAWGPAGTSPETLERRAAAAAGAGTGGEGVAVVLHDHAGECETDGGHKGVVRQDADGSRPAWTVPGVGPVRFVGRVAELDVLREAWADVSGGTSRLVGVEGEAGIGKTALLRAFAAEVDPASLLWVAGEEDERALPFGLVSRLTASPGADELTSALRDWAASLGQGSDPLMVGAGLLGVLTSGGRPLGVVIDDAHLGDRQSLVALGFAARRLLSDPVLIVIGFRPQERHALGMGWERLLAEPAAVTVALEGLAPEELMALAATSGSGPLSPAGASRLFAHTRGHPLYARMLLEQLPATAFESNAMVLPAPASLAQAIVARLGSCAPATRHLVMAAAVMGVGCDPALAAAVARVADPHAAVREAEEAGLLVVEPDAGAGRVAFSHPLLRAAIYHDLDPAERRRLHARAGRLLPSGSALAHRVAAAVGPDGNLADKVERTAQVEAGEGRLQQSAAGLWRAFELTPAGPARVRRLLSAVEARLALGDVAIGQRAEHELSALAPDPWVDYVAGFMALERGRFPEATTRLQRAWAAVQAGATSVGAPGDLAERVATVSAVMATLRVDHADMVRWSGRASGGDSRRTVTGLAAVINSLGTAMAPGGDPVAVLAATRALDSPSDLNRLVARGVLRWWADDLPGAHEDLVSVVERAARGEVLALPSFALGALGATAYRMGRLEEAVLYGELAVATATEAGRGLALAVLNAWACYPRAARGDWDEARAHARAAAEWAGRSGMADPQVAPAAADAILADAHGDDDAFLAAAALLDAGGGSARANIHGFGPVLADALSRIGQTAEAAAALRRFEQDAAPETRPFAALTAARVRGRLAAADGDWETAATLFDRAVELAGFLGVALETAKTHLAAGRAALWSDRLQPAAHHLYAALDAFDSLGADGYATQVVAAIDGAGLAQRRRDRTGVGLLTPAEGAVARLVAGGLSNRDVAARLFVSSNAVAWHLTHIYAKLGVSSRKALVGQFGPDASARHTRAG